MRVLVTGATGWVGRYCTAALAGAGHQVVELTRSPGSRATGGAERVVADLLDPDATERAVREAESERVVHLAGETGRRGQRPDLQQYWEGNVLATLHLMRGLEPSCGGVVVVSSAAVYGEAGTPGQRTRETERTLPTTWYGITKAAQERLAVIEGRRIGVPVHVVRIFNLIGPDGPPRTVAHDLAVELVSRQRRGDALTLERPNTVRDLLDVRDAAEAVRLLATGNQAPDGDPVWNVCTGREVSVKELAEQLAASLPGGPDLRFRARPPGPGDVTYQVGDPERVQRATGWAPFRSLAESARDLIRHLTEAEA